MASGFLFVGGASPAIVVAPEHIFDLGPIAVTNTMFTSWLVVLVLVVIGVITRSGLKMVPTGFAGVLGGIAGILAFCTGAILSVLSRRFTELEGKVDMATQPARFDVGGWRGPERRRGLS